MPSLQHYFHSFLYAIHFLFFSSPTDARSTTISLWLVRITFFSLLLRTYLGPWLLALTSEHIRVRSISLRSIRGLYFRQGTRIWRVERIGYVWSTNQGSRRFALKIDGFTLHLDKNDQDIAKKPKPKRRSNLILSYLKPSPIFKTLWRLVSSFTTLLEPYVRPLVRACVIASLRLGIQWLPRLLQAIAFDLQSAIVTFADVPGAKIVVEGVSLNTALVLSQQTPKPGVTDAAKLRKQEQDNRNASGVAAWRKRLAESFNRSLDMAWGETRGTATLSLKISNVVGSVPQSTVGDSHTVPFLLFPGAIDLSVSAKFNPREGLLEQHSLQVSLKLGDCSAKVDLLKDILEKAIPKKKDNPLTINVPDIVSPSTSGLTNGPPASAFSMTSAASPNIQSPVQSIASSIFSPSSFFSGASLKSPVPSILSPGSANFLSPKFPISPSSPLFKAFSASVRPRRRNLVAPATRLKDQRNNSLLSILQGVHVAIGSISLSVTTNALGPYKAVAQDFRLDVGLSHPDTHPLHRTHLGRTLPTDNSFSEADAYGLKCTLRQVFVERETRHHVMRVARLGAIGCEVLAHQWPAPFLNPSPFLSHDPNGPLLAIHTSVGDVQITERLQDLRRAVLSLESTNQAPKSDVSHPPPRHLHLPRVYFTYQCGPSVSRLIFDAENGKKHRAIELRTNGLTVSLNSEFRHAPTAISRSFPAASTILPLHWSSLLSINIEPVLIRVRSQQDFIGAENPTVRVSDEDFLDDPPLLSVGTLELNTTLNAIGQIDSRSDTIANIDTATLACNVSFVLESICVELWHGTAVDAMLQLLTIRPPKGEPKPQGNPKPFPSVPFGLQVKVSLGRLVVFITAPDVTPEDDLELSRGFAIRTSTSLEYSSLRPSLALWFDDVRKTQIRHRLGLPRALEVDALTVAKTSTSIMDIPAIVRLRSRHFVVRSAVATPFEPDEPAIAGRDDLSGSAQEFVSVDHVQVELTLSRKQIGVEVIPSCIVVVNVPSVLVDFHLAHAYSIMLGMQTIRLLFPPESQYSTLPPPQETKKRINLQLQSNVTSVRILCKLPTQKLVACIENVGAHVVQGQLPRISVSKASIFALLPPRVNRWEEPVQERWGEFLTLLAWDVSISTAEKPAAIAIDGHSGRFRIPHGFIFNDLIHDLAVSAKAIKHMAFMASAGCYSPMPYPEAEGPKSIPQITVRLGSLIVEAEDDPFESKLGLIWRAGADAVKQRLDREEAFEAKVDAIRAADGPASKTGKLQLQSDQEFQFTSKHSVPIAEARRRLDDVHVLDWTLRLEKLKDERAKGEISILRTSRSGKNRQPFSLQSLPEFEVTSSVTSAPPLFRATFEELCLTISPPSFSLSRLHDVMYDYGNGLPRDTKFSLLVPLHIHFTLSSVLVTLRDYPLPLLSIPLPDRGSTISWTFETDLIIAEEMGSHNSVDWVTCPIIEPSLVLHGEAPFSLLIPKTIMPVKTYARPNIHIKSPEATLLSWAVSYNPAIQDLMRVVETLTSPPRDPSPSVGFWDKLRLIMHWAVKITFTNDVRFYMKGTRDPYNVLDNGAGFVLCWQGHPEIRIGYENYQKELVQVLSDDMVIAVPNLDQFTRTQSSRRGPQQRPFKKIAARLSSGVRFGLGFVLERACGLECVHCTGSAFNRTCRYFSFKPHWEVMLEKKPVKPTYESTDDSYNGFRSDFVHLSISLACSTKSRDTKSVARSSSLYLTPKLFAHFWSWCSLFEGSLSLPVRQGKYYPPRPISPKLGRHLATIKYRISLLNLYVIHAYIDDSREAWVDGITPWVGVKGKVDEIQADMHQRDEETTTPGPLPNSTRVNRRKPIYAAEVIIKGLELRALLATFAEPLKKDVEISAPAQRSNYRKHTGTPVTSSSSPWYDLEDFVELDWTAHDAPVLNLLPVATCPHFTYVKKNSALDTTTTQTSKFGSEHTHVCLLGKEPSVPKTQILLATNRLTELKARLESGKVKVGVESATLKKSIALLENYISTLRDAEINPDYAQDRDYHLPSDTLNNDESAGFDNVYQIHCPSIFLDSIVRDIMMQYYYCSRDRRGFEYHMSARAVKFIRDQAKATLVMRKDEPVGSPNATAAAAPLTSALWKILKNESNTKLSVDISRDKDGHVVSDPLQGWGTGVSLQKSNSCLLVKPQIILRGDTPTDTCVLAASQAKLQSFAIMDNLNINDPITGKVMSRNYSSVSGLQCFAPAEKTHLIYKDGSVPLEILIDLRCESQSFERLAPQTEASFQYDKFNRLRLRNNVTSVAKTGPQDSTASLSDSHLEDQTDLIRVHIPRFTVSANAEHFAAISNIVTTLLLFSDPAHKTRLDRLETMVFTYDFTDLASAADVVNNMQSRLRDALETEAISMRNPRRLEDDEGRLSFLQLKAHIFLLAEELNLLFDAIKLAQDRFDDQTDQKSALLLHASSSEISWRMLDTRRNLLSKLVVSSINFHWLSRQDSSTVNHLTIGNLTSFDGSRYAIWTEILSKYDEPSNHPLYKKKLFLLAKWIILPPVGGITIYECFELSLHPVRLQIDAKVGHRMMEYVWPEREERKSTIDESVDNGAEESNDQLPLAIETKISVTGRSSIDSPRGLHSPSRPLAPDGKVLIPPLRKLGSSRSFTDLRSSKEPTTLTNAGFLSPPAFLKRTHSSESLNIAALLDQPTEASKHDSDAVVDQRSKDADDAQVMKTRSAQKTFVSVKISSVHVLLSVIKEGSFECHDARIKTRELEYKNQTWSFEELVNQFIPSNMSWRGWVKMAFHQPLLPVLPVARELLSKTKWGSSKTIHQPHSSPLQLLHPRMFTADDDSRLKWAAESSKTIELGTKTLPKKTALNPLKIVHKETSTPIIASGPLTAEPESLDAEFGQASERSSGRQRVKTLFTKGRSSKSKGPTKRQSEDTVK